jgi:hypothetical protein
MDEYQKYQMIDSGITATGLHKFSYSTGAGIADVRYTAVRAGIAFPTDKSPFHLVIVGQEYFDPQIYVDTSPVYELLFELSDHGLDLEARHGKLADCADLYKCDFYANLAGINEVGAESYRDFKAKHSYGYGGLLEAPYSANIRLGVELLRSHVKDRSLDIPKDSPAFEQLSRITEADLAEPDVMGKFYAVESLRHCMASYKRDPKSSGVLKPFRTQHHIQGWML